MNKQIDNKIGPSGHRRRLKERFLQAGRKALADYEFIELLLTYSTPRIKQGDDNQTAWILKKIAEKFTKVTGLRY